MEVPASPREYLAGHCRLATDDLDLAREVVGQLWERHHSELKRGRKYAIRWHQAGFAGSTLSFARSPSALRVECGPVSQALHLTLVESGRLCHRIEGREMMTTPGHAVVYAPGHLLELETQPFSMLMVSFNGEAMTSNLRRRFEREPAAPPWPCGFALNTTAGATLRGLCRWAARELDRPGAAIATCQTAAASLETMLLALLLDCVDQQGPADRRRTDDLTKARVRRVEDFMLSRLTSTIDVDEMAAEVGVCVRSLQDGFRRHRGCTPMQRLQQLRLEAAHKALSAPSPGCTVTRVAADLGFFHFGRFSVRYRQTFGESPSETLTRARKR